MLAAGILKLTGWNPATQHLVDPMCGSGTLPIEAAMVALDVFPIDWVARDVRGAYTITMFGRTRGGEAVAVHIPYFPYFYLEAPAGVDDMADNTCHFGLNNMFADNGLDDGYATSLYFPADVHQVGSDGSAPVAARTAQSIRACVLGIHASMHRCIDTSMHRASIRRYVDTSIHPCIDTSMHRYIDISIHRHIHASIHRCIDASTSIHPSMFDVQHTVPA